MATFSFLLPLLRLIYYFFKLCGFSRVYYNAHQQSFKLLTSDENYYELFHSRLLYFINLAATVIYIAIRLVMNYTEEKMYAVEPGVRPPPNLPQTITDSAFAAFYFFNCIFFKYNQKRFVTLGNELLVIHRALWRKKTQLRFSNILLLLSYILFIFIIYIIGITISTSFKNIRKWFLTGCEFKDMMWLILLLTSWTYLLYALHLLLLLVFFVLLSGYCRQLSDLLLNASNKTAKRSEKLMKILPLLQTVQQRASCYFSFFMLLRILELLYAIYCLLKAFKYDDETLHPLLEDFEEMELDQKMYHAPVVQRSEEVYLSTIKFLIQTFALLLELYALSVCKREHRNILDVIIFPIDTHSTRPSLNADQIYRLEVLPDTIIVCNDTEPQINLFDLMLDNEKKLIRLSLDDTFGLHIGNFKVPLKLLKHSVHKICCSTIVMTLLDKLQQTILKKYEQKLK